MDDALRQLKNNISNLSDGELVEMVTAGADEYREEAIAFAREELEARGVNVDEAPASEEAAHQEDESVALPPSGAGCLFCNGPLQRAALVGDKELIVAFREGNEQRFVDVLVCRRCGEARLVVDLESEVEE